MPGPQFSKAGWDMYDAIRKRGVSKELAARIVNSRKPKHGKPRPLLKAAKK